MVRNNPNAAVAVGTGTIATLLVGGLSLAGFEIDAALATAVATVLTAAVLLVGRKGIRGIFAQLWRGEDDGA